MKCFTEESGSFRRKVNYVDAANRVLGYDMDRDCCEDFGHMVCASIPDGVPDDAKAEASGIEAYSFCDEPPTKRLRDAGVDEGGYLLAFRIAAPGLPDLFVCLWNYHNGYYSHGWEWSGSEAFPKTTDSI